MTATVPIVNYLALDGDRPHLIETVCTGCGAVYFGRRIACARCGGRDFTTREALTEGTLRSFSIVHRAAKTIRTPFVSGIVVLDDGGVVKANVLDCLPDPEHVVLGMRVTLRIYAAATDHNETTAIAFGFAAVDKEQRL